MAISVTIAIAIASASACSAPELDEPGRSHETSAPAHLARIHLALQPLPDPITAEPQLDLSARFVRFRGLDEDEVRSRVNLVPLPYEGLAPGSCVASEALDGVDTRERAASGSRQLHLLDAGNLLVHFGTHVRDLPLVLLPDLLPYMSGVEYQDVADTLPSVIDYPRITDLRVEIEGSDDGEIPATELYARLPRPLGLSLHRGLQPDVLELRWRRDPRIDLPLIFRLAAYVGGEPVGAEVTCATVDRGAFRLHLDALRDLGLGAAGEGLYLRASRFTSQRFDAGEFTAAELIVELREATFIVLR